MIYDYILVSIKQGQVSLTDEFRRLNIAGWEFVAFVPQPNPNYVVEALFKRPKQ